MSLTKPINMTEKLRRELVLTAIDSVDYLKNFSDDKTYQSHVDHLISLLKLTEMALNMERFNNAKNL